MRGRCWSQQGIKLPADGNAPGLIFRECVRCGAMNWELAAPLVVEPGETKTIVLRTPAQRNAEVRAREYLTGAEVEKLIAAAGDNRSGCERNMPHMDMAIRTRPSHSPLDSISS